MKSFRHHFLMTGARTRATSTGVARVTWVHEIVLGHDAAKALCACSKVLAELHQVKATRSRNDFPGFCPV